MVNEFCKNYETIFWVSILMASAMIVAIGFLKKAFLNKLIKNDSVRDAVLSAINVVASFLVVAITFWIKGITFDYYWFTAVAFCIYSIFVYWLYNHTKAKAGIHKLGKYVWAKFETFAVTKVNNVVDAIVTTKSATSAILKPTDTSLKKNNAKNDDELDALK
jgi:hypothetical protein